MTRLLLFILVVAGASAGLSWLADRPGSVQLNWMGYEIETSVFMAVVAAALGVAALIFLWTLAKLIFGAPFRMKESLRRKRKQRGMEAITGGLIAIGSGDKALANRFAEVARKSVPDEPLTALLRAQAAQLSGDRKTARGLFEAMLESPETAALGLRGLYLEAEAAGEVLPARQYAERALVKNPALAWAAQALLDMHVKAQRWDRALEMLNHQRKHKSADKTLLDRKRAVLLTAQAMEIEAKDRDKALEAALEAHRLAPDLVPAAEIAARTLSGRGNVAKAARIIEETWRVVPHPDLAVAYAYARPGDSPRDRLKRVKELAKTMPKSPESAIAVAQAAIDAHAWDEARAALEPLLAAEPSARVCTLMARIEGGQHGDKGRVREWLARAARAPRDPAWTADGYVSDQWQPISPKTGQLDTFRWQQPAQAIAGKAAGAQMIDDLIALSEPDTSVLEAAETIDEGHAGPTLDLERTLEVEAREPAESLADQASGTGKLLPAAVVAAGGAAAAGAAFGNGAGLPRNGLNGGTVPGDHLDAQDYAQLRAEREQAYLEAQAKREAERAAAAEAARQDAARLEAERAARLQSEPEVIDPVAEAKRLAAEAAAQQAHEAAIAAEAEARAAREALMAERARAYELAAEHARMVAAEPVVEVAETVRQTAAMAEPEMAEPHVDRAFGSVDETPAERVDNITTQTMETLEETVSEPEIIAEREPVPQVAEHMAAEHVAAEHTPAEHALAEHTLAEQVFPADIVPVIAQTTEHLGHEAIAIGAEPGTRLSDIAEIARTDRAYGHAVGVGAVAFAEAADAAREGHDTAETGESDAPQHIFDRPSRG